MTLGQLEERLSWVAWREPVTVLLGSGDFFGCRVCIANDGLRGDGSQADRLFGTTEEFDAHFRELHGEPVV